MEQSIVAAKGDAAKLSQLINNDGILLNPTPEVLSALVQVLRYFNCGGREYSPPRIMLVFPGSLSFPYQVLTPADYDDFGWDMVTPLVGHLSRDDLCAAATRLLDQIAAHGARRHVEFVCILFCLQSQLCVMYY